MAVQYRLPACKGRKLKHRAKTMMFRLQSPSVLDTRFKLPGIAIPEVPAGLRRKNT